MLPLPPQGPLTYKGVVFNEMKGVYSSPDSVNGRVTQARAATPWRCSARKGLGLSQIGLPSPCPHVLKLSCLVIAHTVERSVPQQHVCGGQWRRPRGHPPADL